MPKELQPFVHRPTHDIGKSKWGTGITKWEQHAWDQLWRIAQMYGLPRGATLSGTTADHMFALFEILGKVDQDVRPQSDWGKWLVSQRIDKKAIKTWYEYFPFLILIPTIQMVRQFHHALHETAVILSTNYLISYHVGYYQELLRNEGGSDRYGKRLAGTRPILSRSTAALQKEVKKILKQADGSVRHMYCVCESTMANLKPNQPAGFAVDPNNLAEAKDHFEEAYLSSERIKPFEDIPEKWDTTYIKNKYGPSAKRPDRSWIKQH